MKKISYALLLTGLSTYVFAENTPPSSLVSSDNKTVTATPTKVDTAASTATATQQPAQAPVIKAKKDDFWKDPKLFGLLMRLFDFIGENNTPKTDMTSITQGSQKGQFVVSGSVASQEFRLASEHSSRGNRIAQAVANNLDLAGINLQVHQFKLKPIQAGSTSLPVLPYDAKVFLPRDVKLYPYLTAIYMAQITDLRNMIAIYQDYLAWDNNDANLDTLMSRLDSQISDLQFFRDNLENSDMASYDVIDRATKLAKEIKECFIVKKKKSLVGPQTDETGKKNYFLTEDAGKARAELEQKVARLAVIAREPLKRGRDEGASEEQRPLKKRRLDEDSFSDVNG